MSESHSLAMHLEHHAPAAFLTLPFDLRRRVELALLHQVRQRVPAQVQEDWLDPARLDIKPVIVDGVALFTLDAINTLFGKALAAVDSKLSLGATLRATCRHCQPYHCDRVCREVLLDGAPWVISARTDPADPTTTFRATVALEFQFPSPS